MRLIAVAATLLAALSPYAALAQDESGEWQLDPYARIEAGIVLSQSSDSEDELIIVGDGGYVRGAAGVTWGDDVTTFRLEADRIQTERFGNATGRGHYDRDRITVSATRQLGDDWEVELRGRMYDDLVTAESSDTDELSAAVRIEYEPVLDHRLRAQLTWRERNYDDGQGPGGTASTGQGPRLDVEYRYRLGRYNYLNLDLRAEEINSDNPQRSFTREAVGVSYTQPITRDLRVRPAIEYRHTRFDGRIAPDGQPREDNSVVPEIELLWWPGDWRIEAEAKYIATSSNDPLRDREGYRFSLTVGYVF
ncbi:MAG: hypothetical protein KDE15_05875 [Erythrobacter sp.]|nr:hypothetical protein [Erythrobacter sp.]